MINNKENNFISAVVYLHKNEKNAVAFFEVLANVLQDNFKRSEIICVNDGISQDVLKTLRTADEKFPDLNITIINMGFSHGLEAAMNAGIDLSIGDFVFEFDSCYMDYDKSLIMDVYFKSLEGYDIVSAVPPKNQAVSHPGSFIKCIIVFQTVIMSCVQKDFQLFPGEQLTVFPPTVRRFRTGKPCIRRAD